MSLGVGVVVAVQVPGQQQIDAALVNDVNGAAPRR